MDVTHTPGAAQMQNAARASGTVGNTGSENTGFRYDSPLNEAGEEETNDGSTGEIIDTPSERSNEVQNVGQDTTDSVSDTQPAFEAYPPAPQNPQSKTSSQAMPPPFAAASLLPSLQPSGTAKWDRCDDPAVFGRLIAVCVIFFRQGRAVIARKLGQFIVDLVGKDRWDEELPTYMRAEPLENDNATVVPLLRASVEILKALDRMSSAYLAGMLNVWEEELRVAELN